MCSQHFFVKTNGVGFAVKVFSDFSYARMGIYSSLKRRPTLSFEGIK